MKYEYHNFTENFKSIKNSKDMALTRELMLSEITKVIVGRPALVKKALIGCGVSINERGGKKELAKAIAFSLTELCVREKLMTLIASNQLPFETETGGNTPIQSEPRPNNTVTPIQSKPRPNNTVVETREDRNFKNPTGAISNFKTPKDVLSNFDTDESREKFMNGSGDSKISGSDWINAGTQILGTLGGILQGNKAGRNASEQRAHELKLANMNYELMLMQMNMSADQPVSGVTQSGIGGGSTVTYILLGVGALAIIGFAIYSSRKQD